MAHNGAEPIDYPYSYIAPTNTGVPSGFDLDNDGTVGGPDDAFGFGDFEGQFGMVVLSRFPIVADGVRTFQNLLWTSMPGARLPDDPATPEPADFYSPEELAVLRLSSTSHWDVPVYVDGRIVHVLAAHPTTPVLDGPENRNGLRNADEIRFWADYVAGDAAWIVDDAGVSGGLTSDSEFVIVGDMNSDPVDGDSVAGATDQLLTINRIQDPAAASEGAVEAAERRARRTRPTPATRRWTPPTSRTTRWATCVSITSCLRTDSTSSPPTCSGRATATSCRVSSRSTRWQVRTTASCGSTSSDGRLDRVRDAVSNRGRTSELSRRR